ncbi:MAG: multicopper oxidase domain-containing protein [Paracoccus sp. (in: a-proteobacteria)]
MQEINLLAAPLIVRTPEDLMADRQEVVMMLHDLSFKSPGEVMEEITGGHGNGHAVTPAAPQDNDMPGMKMGGISMPMGQMDLNNYEWDAYLANEQTLDDPEIVQVDRGTRILLRIINAASATVFWIDTGGLPGHLIAVDGHRTAPAAGSRFGIAMGQRLDIEIEQPFETGAWPILALREGARERTGLILATPGATVPKLATMGETEAPAFDIDLRQEANLTAINPLNERKADRQYMVMLGGTMAPYRWTIDGKTWGDHTPIEARPGERVELMFHNMSMMVHPMHLHGYAF